MTERTRGRPPPSSAWTLGVGKEIAITVALTVAAIVLWSTVVGSILTPLLEKLGVDPGGPRQRQ